MKRIWIISELYYPEETSTGWFVTKIAEGLKSEFDVRVLCAKPTYSERHMNASTHEKRHGTTIKRVWSTRFSKDSLPGRLSNLLTLTTSLALNVLFSLRRGDRLLVLTNPPTIPPIVGMIAKLRRAKPALLMHDVYPEVLAATGVVETTSPIYRLIDVVMNKTLRLYDPIVVLGRDMQTLIERKVPGREPTVRIVTNWADLHEISPLQRDQNSFAAEHVLEGKTVIQLSGNMGRTHDVELLLEVARRLQDRDDIRFLFVGSGAKTKMLRSQNASGDLDNVIVLPRQPRERLRLMLACSDATVIPFLPKMFGVSVPSRMYNVMAAGVPIIAVADPASELAMTVVESNSGWRVDPEDADGLESVVLEVANNRDAAAKRGQAAREVAIRKFSLEQIISDFEDLLTR